MLHSQPSRLSTYWRATFPPFRMGGGQFEFVRQALEEGRVFGYFHQFGPDAFKAFLFIVNQAGIGKNTQLGENLEPVADAQEHASTGVVPLQGIPQETFRFQLGQAAAGDVVPVAEAASQDDKLGFGDMFRRSRGDGLDLGGETCRAQGAFRFHVAVGAGVFQ